MENAVCSDSRARGMLCFMEPTEPTLCRKACAIANLLKPYARLKRGTKHYQNGDVETLELL